MRLSFRSGVPESREIRLVVRSSSEGIFQFEMKKEPASDFSAIFPVDLPSLARTNAARIAGSCSPDPSKDRGFSGRSKLSPGRRRKDPAYSNA